MLPSFNVNLFRGKYFSDCLPYSDKFDLITSHNFKEKKPNFSGHYFYMYKSIKRNFQIYFNESLNDIL